ncbi:MAG: domain / Band 7 family protein, partial [Caulobacter sp.]|nr:domain / Band 7 family protein [Caulobacter sp.]
LRAMNIVYETTKERGATILMPSSMVDAMNPAAIATALAAANGGAAKAVPAAAKPKAKPTTRRRRAAG